MANLARTVFVIPVMSWAIATIITGLFFVEQRFARALERRWPNVVLKKKGR